MSSPSSATMCTSTDDCFCHEHVRQRRSPSSAYAQRRMSSADMASKSSSGRGGALAIEQDLLQRVAAQAEAQGLERDDLLRRNVPEVHVRPELLDEPGLRGLRGCLENELRDIDLVRDLVDQPGPHLAVRPVDPRGAALAAPGDQLPGSGLELFLSPFDPLLWR